FLDPARARFLEYDLTKLVWNLSQPHRAVLGVMSSLPLDGNPRLMMMAHGEGDAGQPWASMLQLRSTFDIRSVKTDAQVIDPAIQVLLVVQPQHLSAATLYAIDQFVMRGGHLLAMVDPASEAQAAIPGPDGQPAADTSSDLAPLFKAWGIDYDPNSVVGDLSGDWRVRAGNDEAARPTNYVAWFNISSGIDKNDPAIGGLHRVTVASAGALAPAKGAKITFTPILSSSKQSEMVSAAEVRNNPDPAKILASFEPDGKPRVIAARITGMLHSAFTGPPALPKGVKRAPGLPPYLATTKRPANLVVVADTDILADRFWVQTENFFGQRQATPFSDNGPFVADLVGQLAGGDALIGLRGRGPSDRPFTRIDRMQAAAEAQFEATANALESHLTAVQAKLTSLRTDASGAHGTMAAVITPAQRSAIAAARADIVRTRDHLRLVQRDLRRNIASLESVVKVLDIAAVPLLLAAGAIVLALVRRRRRATARRVHA
ncbi:MAG TPA: Gldg family protein, partial [Acetobacteraceae bacterium]|nr:Gldg family protein [Acetobacteraceae bacterium]